MGRGFGRLSLLSGGGGGFDLVRDVFGGGAYAGLYLDFTSLTQIGGLDPLYTASDGVTPVTANGNTIGLALSQDSGPTLGSELVTNGTFGVDTTGWSATDASLSVSSGQLLVTSTNILGRAVQAITTVVGCLYRVSGGKVDGTANATMRVGTSNGGSQYFNFTADGTQTGFFIATSTTTYISCLNATGTALYDDISLKLVAGNHAYQGTSGSRGTWSSDGYWLGDGSDDHLVTGLVPAAAMTMVVCALGTASNDMLMSSATATGRCNLYLESVGGKPAVGWGSTGEAIKGPSDVRNTLMVLLLRGQAGTQQLWHDGSLIGSATDAGTPNTSIPIILGAQNNNGTPALYLAGRIYRALAVQRYLPDNLILPTMRALGAGIVSF